MKKSSVLLFLILFCADALALGIGVVPDRLVFDGTAQQAVIVNPNNISLEYNVLSEYISCEPSEGKIGPMSRAAVLCIANEGAKSGVILVETNGPEESVGVIPAVAIKAEVKWEDDGTSGPVHIDDGATDQKEEDRPLVIDRETRQKEEDAHEEETEGVSILVSMTAEMITIMFLTAAILFVLAYSEIRNRKRKKESGKSVPNGSTAASSRQASQDGQSSASGSASPDQP